MKVTPRENVTIMTTGENITSMVDLKVRQKWDYRKTPLERYVVSKAGISLNLDQKNFDKYFTEFINE